MKKKLYYIYILFGLLMWGLVSCTSSSKSTYRIGFSQCSGGIWRELMLQEMQDELLLHQDLELRYRCAYDQVQLQCQQIDSFIQERVDILVVAPYEINEVQNAVTRAYEAGIPVIVFDRPLPGNQWTAFIGGDNRQVGLVQVQWLRQLQRSVQRPIRVVEFTGSMTSSPAILRHAGVLEGLRTEPNIQLVASLDGEWEKTIADHLCDSLLSVRSDIDAIMAHSDWMAYGIADVVERHCRRIPVIGVDALPGAYNGIEAVLSGRLAASTVYPSRGDLVIRLASQILHGEPFERETHLSTELVLPDNARSLNSMYEAYQSQIDALKTLRGEVNLLAHQYGMQKIVIILLFVLILLLISMVIGVWMWHAQHKRMMEQQAEKDKLIMRQQMHLEQMTEQIESMTADVPNLAEDDSQFIHHLTNQIELLMTNQDLGVETLARAMGMSRTALFRRVKDAIGRSPIELISQMRLQRAQKLLEAGNMTVQQVAYEVGFTSPSYFARCYKDMFGHSPSGGKNVA